MLKTFLFFCLYSFSLYAKPSLDHEHILLMGDSTMVMNCRIPGWMPKYAECRAIGGQSYHGYIHQLDRGCESVIILGSTGLNAGWGIKSLEQIERDFWDYALYFRNRCPNSKWIVVGINKNKLPMTERDRQEFNNFVKLFVDQYVEPPFGLEEVYDGVHYTRKASWMLWPLLFEN